MRSVSSELHPATRAAELQRRLRQLTSKLRAGEAYHVELDAIANELGELSMQLESYDPSCHVWHGRPRARPGDAAASVERALQPRHAARSALQA